MIKKDVTELSCMARASDLAARGLGHTRPNPAVGAVIVSNGRIVGEGWHQRCGERHAEVMALRNCRDTRALADATLYVTLEPCSKAGRVGACTDAIVASGIGRVVWACADPNPANRGKAANILRRHGIKTACWQTSKVAAERNAAHDVWNRLLRPFAKHVTTGLPFVTVKLAFSLDGRIADDAGRSQWISGVKARQMTGRMRERVDVVMVGAETVRKDNPSLLCHTRRNDDLWRAVISKSGRLPKNAQLFTDAAKDRTLVYRDAGEAVRDLGRRGFMHVLCEGGLELARALAAEGLADEWINVVAPIVIGHAPLAEARRFAENDTFITYYNERNES